MEQKTIYLIRGSKNESYPAFRDRVLEILYKVKENYDLADLWVTITVERPPRRSIIPFRKAKIAAISVKGGSGGLITGLTSMPGFSGAYLVEEAIPVAHKKEWPDGVSTPGVNLLTLFSRKPGLSWEKFIDRWHNSHTPLSLRIHPLWNYNRNVVRERLTDNSAVYDGIVEEQMKTREDLLNPLRFFGNVFVLIPRMIAVYTDTNAFLDYKKIETYLAEEIILKS
jgi:hypothetical protein